MNQAATGAASEAASAWDDALLMAALFAVDPAGLGGVLLHARAGPVRDAWLGALRALLPDAAPWCRTPAAVGDAALLGGLDLVATVQAGRPVGQRGLLARANGGVVVLAMAERLPAGTAARLTAAMDLRHVTTERDGTTLTAEARFGVVALDESEPEGEQPAAAIVDRLAFLLDLGAIGIGEARQRRIERTAIDPARKRYAAVEVDDAALEALCRSAQALGILSLRACLLAVAACRAHAALAGRTTALVEDAAVAARLVLSPRATVMPQDPDVPADAAAPEPSPEPADTAAEQRGNADESVDRDGDGAAAPSDIVLAAAKAAIPAHLLAKLGRPPGERAGSSAAGKFGASSSSLRGRPVGVREAAPRDGQRLNLMETLRAAAPWQMLRRREGGTAAGPRPLIRSRDFRVNRLEQRARTTTIFVVDASGSSAFNRLAEIKGAVELLLADCYRRRDEVAVLAFRGRGTSLLLPPTRSLVRAKRCLAALPGGGPTPLAAGIQAGTALAMAVKRGGFTPTLVFLTDGCGNIALDGTAGRGRAGQDARQAGQHLQATGLRTLLVDSSPRPQMTARVLADAMGAMYLPLPYADAAGLSRRVKAAVGASS